MKHASRLLTLLGVLLLAAALGLTIFNLRQDAAAGEAAETALETLLPELEAAQTIPAGEAETAAPAPQADYVLYPEMEMPVQTVDGREYLGVLQIPALSLELPVLSEWSYDNLAVAPCRYSGSAYQKNLVIAGHNYSSFFADLKQLTAGDTVTFTDVDGNVFSYQVADLEVLAPDAVPAMTESGWALTLFTCTVGGQSRIAVRCEEMKP